MKAFARAILAAGVAFGLPQPHSPPGGTGFIGTYQCAQDNCFRAVLATNVNPREQARRKRECSLLLKTTVLGTPTSVVTQKCRATTYTETVQVTVYQPTATNMRVGGTTTARSNSSQMARENKLAASKMAALTTPSPELTTNVKDRRDRDADCSRCLKENHKANRKRNSAAGPNVTVILPPSTAQTTTTQQVPGIGGSTGTPPITVTTTFTTTHSYLTETHTSTVAPPSLDMPIAVPAIPVPLPTVPLPTPSVPIQVPTIVPVPTVPIPIPTMPTLAPPPIPIPTVPDLVPIPTLPIPIPTIPIPVPTLPVPVPTVPIPIPTIPVPVPTIPIPVPTIPVPTVTATKTGTTQAPPVPTSTPPVPTVQPPLPPLPNTPTPQPTTPPADEGNEFALLAIPGYATELCTKPEDYVSACECYGVRPQVSTKPPAQAVSTHWVYNTATTTATVTMPGVPCRRKREVCAPSATDTITLRR
ncbi:hypothetical protein PspLS_08807 [Pyricularia sp. CBS 133598]|nr:hypothetical protein PspLS_08807 [Pyricularia sp. CBS 133598]